jgi:hairy and enhancer of split related with YRPW motif
MTGINYASNGIDPHLLGFQECAAEIQRFIVQDEQFSAQDQLRSRLLSHLQCYTAQRETFKPSHTAWHSPGHYPTGPTGLVPPPPPVGLSGSSLLNGCSPADSMSGNGLAPSCLGTSYGAATPTSSFSPSPSQYPAAFQATNHMQSMYTSQANYASARTYRPWAGHELVY